jgi:hypothetical protein
MSFLQLKNSSASSHISKIGHKLRSADSGEGSVGADVWITAIIKIACLFVIGIVILESVVNNTGVNNSSEPFYDLMVSVKSNITSGYTLASLMVLVIGAGAVIHFLGFV